METGRLLEVGLAALLMLGSLVAYTETKFASKEQTRGDIQRIENKLDRIYDLMIQRKGK